VTIDKVNDFSNMDHSPAAVMHAGDMDDNVQRVYDLLQSDAPRFMLSAHADHIFESGYGIQRIVGMQRSHGSIVAGIHCLKHFRRFRSPHLANDDPVRTHPEGVFEQVVD